MFLRMASTFNLPMISHYCTYGATSDKTLYRTFARTRPPSTIISKSLASLLLKYNWTHVAFTWENFNTGKKDGVATLYLDGKNEGSITKWNQKFSWAGKPHRILIGLNYMGLFDELACFNRALSSKEINHIFDHQKSLNELIK